MRTAVAILAFVALLAVSVAAQSSTGGTGPAASGICEKLTQNLGLNPKDPAAQYKTISTLIGRVALGTTNSSTATDGIFKNTATKDYFNGVINYRASSFVPSPFASKTPGRSPNFNTETDSLNALVAHLTEFFGPSLGCAVGTATSAYPPYSYVYNPFGTFTQYQVHANMNISQSVFSVFNTQVLTAAMSIGGITTEDGVAVSAVLNSFGRNNVLNGQANEICTQIDCTCATGITGANCDNQNSVSSVQVSFVTLALAAIAAVFAMRR